jgi:ketosteroid isomerase-like protein
MTMDRDKLLAYTRDFTDAFNRNDLDAVMSYFGEDAVYDEFDGTVSRGPEAIRAAFEPQFSGAYGPMEFREEDCFVDAEAGRALISWTVTLEVKGQPLAWRGLDILHVEDDLITHKLTYAKAKAPLFGSAT